MANILETIPRIVILTEIEEVILLDDGPEILVFQNGGTEFESVEVLDIRGEDRIDISAFDLDSEDIPQLISGALPLENGGGVRIIGPFGQLQLLGITEGVLDQIGSELFITNTAPVALDDIATTVENIPVSINVLDANGFSINILNEEGQVVGIQDMDIDPNGDLLAVSDFATTTAFGGSISVDSNGLLIYTPGFGFTGTDSFGYTITDGELTSTAVVTVTVVEDPDVPPIAVDDLAETSENIPVDIFVLDNDFDPNGDNISIVDFPQTTAGGSVSSAGVSLTYQPGFGFFGTDSFNYTISDGNFTDTATVTVTVEEINVPPIAVDDLAETSENIPVDILVLDNDFDPNGDNISIVDFAETTAAGGLVSEAGGTLTYQPGFGFFGTESFNYTISDGNFTDTATVTVTVSEVNDAPIAVDDVVSTTENIAVDVFVLDNDFDPEGDVISIAGFDESTDEGGTVTSQGNTLSYQPGAGFVGTDSFGYTITDGDLTSTAVVRVTVAPDPDVPPIAVDDLAETSENIPVDILVLDNDFDPNGDNISIVDFAETTASGGIVSEAGGTLTYQPGFGFFGTESFNYTISDGNFTDTATVTVTVQEVNDAPIAVDDVVSTTENIAVDVFVLDNDFDPEGDVISIAGFDESTDEGGTVTSQGNTLSYQPGAGFVGTDSFGYTITDGDLTSTAVVTVTVAPDPDVPPIAVDDFAQTDEDISVSIPVLDNDFDPNGDIISIVEFAETTAAGGSVSAAGGSLTYQPGLGFFGSDSFDYTISDGLFTSTATVTVTVSEVNQSPIAVDDFAATTEDIPVNIFVLENDSDPDGDAFFISGFAQTTASGGEVSQEGETLLYTPSSGFVGTESFIYTISDGQDTSTAEVTVTTEPDPPPIAVDDFAQTDEDIPVDIFVLDNDFDPNGDIISIVNFAETTAAGGIVNSAGGSLTYQPGFGFFGTDSFDYTISDGNLTSTATVTVTVSEVNQSPIAADDFELTTEDIPVNIFVLDNDIDDDVVSISSFEETTTLGGQVSQDGNALIYFPEFGFTGIDSFIYTIADSFGETSSAVVTVTVGPNDPPEANPDEAITTQNLPVAISVLENDSDPDGDLVSIFNFAAFTGQGGSVSIDDNQLFYTPAEDFTGTDVFGYTITDSFGAIGSSTVTVTVEPDNNDPTAVDDEATTFEETPVELRVLDNDFDIDGDLVEISDFPSTSAAGGTIAYDANGTIDRNDDLLEYTPPADFTGTDSFTYTIVDEKDATSTATVTVTVEPLPNPPEAVEDFAETLEDEPVSIDVLVNDTDVDGDRLEIAGFPETTAGGGTVNLENNGTPFNPDDDFLVYEPALGFTGTDSFIYTVSDGLLTDTATVTVTTRNQPPIALPDFAETPENTNVTIDVLENDFDINGDPISISGVSATAGGGTVDIESSDPELLLYSPAEDFTGTDSFSYTISDGELTDTATVTVTVTEVNEEPVAVDDEATTDEGTLVTIDVVDNDFDPDGDPLEIIEWEQFTENRGLVILQDNELVYGPAPGFIGTDSFSYRISDGELTDTATVTVTVLEINEEPVAVDDRATTVQGIEVDIEVLENDFDPDGDPLEIIDFAETTESGGTVSINVNLTPFDPSDDIMVYEPADDFTGTDSFTYTIADSSGATDTATVNVTVESNAGTIAADDFANTNVNVPVSIDVLFNDIDLDGDPISLEAFQATTTFGGIVNRNNNGTPGDRTDDFLTYTPAVGFAGTDSFSYTISDDRGVTDTATVTVAVIEPNNAPIAVDDVALTTEGLPTAIAVLNNDFDEDGDFPFIVDFSAFTPSGGNVTSDGSNLIYAPAFGSSDIIDSFNYTISDGELTDTATVTVAVNMLPNGIPVAGDDTGVTTEGISTSIAVLDNDSDPEGDPLFIIGISNTTTFGGTVALGGLDNLIYNPAFGFTGTDSFSYTIADTRSGIPAVGTVTVTVAPDPNVAPVAVEDSQVTNENIPVAIDVLANDFDLNGDLFSIAGFAQTTVFGGSVSQQLDGTLLYNPAFGFDGTDSFNYTITDGALNSTATVTVTVQDINQAPIAVDDFEFTTENTSVTAFVLNNDSDPDFDGISIDSFESFTGSGGTVAQIDDALIYTPAFGFTGPDSFTYTITDGELIDTATVTVTVDPQPIPDPVANPDEFAIVQGRIASLPVLINDTPEDGLLRIIDVSDPPNGSVEINEDEDRVLYTPDAGFPGTDSFTYTIQDQLGRVSTAIVNVGGDAPIVGEDQPSEVIDNQIIRENITGGAGNDTLIGNEGADVLSGGAGADVFAYLRLSDSGADPEEPFESGDTIVDFEPGVDEILLNFEVAPGIQVSPTDVEINLLGISSGVAAIGLNTDNPPADPDFLPEQFVIVLTDLPTTTTETELLDSLRFSGL